MEQCLVDLIELLDRRLELIASELARVATAIETIVERLDNISSQLNADNPDYSSSTDNWTLQP